MRDAEIVASIVAGDPDGLAAAYDKYAVDLYGYCQSLLRDPDDAADAVQDTFVIAASKLAALRDPERLRAWLFTVARNECLHRLKARRAATPLQDAPEPVDDSVDVGGDAERAETAALVRAAVGGLNDGERDVINQFWHGLDVSEVAAVLGVSRNYAYTLFARARDQLEASVAVLLVGRTGRRDCAALDRLLGDWDGRLTALLRKRVGRHIDRCQVCSDRRRRELTPALLYGLSPGALIAAATLRGISARTAAQPGGPLSVIRDTMLRLASHPASHMAAYHKIIRRSAHSFWVSGFPRPPRHGYLGVAQAHLPSALAGGTAIAASAAVMVSTVVPHLHPAQHPPGGGPALGTSALGTPAPGTQAPGTQAPGTQAPGSAPPRPASGTRAARSSGTAGPPATGPTTAGGTASAPGPTASGGPAAASLLVTASGGESLVPTVPAARVGAGPVPGAPATATAGPASGGPAGTGTLTATPATVLLSPVAGGTLLLTASGGPVSWSIAEPASLLGKLTVTPLSGTLSAGSSVTVAITAASLVSLDTRLTVQPGGQPVTVLLGHG